MTNRTYLVHHGIRGQKWGVRRFQEEDGTLTAAGKQRYADYKSLNRRDRRAYRRASKALGRQDITRQEIKDARSMSKRTLRNLQAYQDSGMSYADARKKAFGKQTLTRAAVAASISAGSKVVGGLLVGKLNNKTLGFIDRDLAGEVNQNLAKVVAKSAAKGAAKSAAGTVIMNYMGMGVNDLLYENIGNRHGVGKKEQ